MHDGQSQARCTVQDRQHLRSRGKRTAWEQAEHHGDGATQSATSIWCELLGWAEPSLPHPLLRWADWHPLATLLTAAVTVSAVPPPFTCGSTPAGLLPEISIQALGSWELSTL